MQVYSYNGGGGGGGGKPSQRAVEYWFERRRVGRNLTLVGKHRAGWLLANHVLVKITWHVVDRAPVTFSCQEDDSVEHSRSK